MLKFKRSIAQGRSPAVSSARLSLQEEFRSAVGIDYTKLNTLLVEGNWQKANQETWDLMCEALSKIRVVIFLRQKLSNFPVRISAQSTSCGRNTVRGVLALQASIKLIKLL
ncbi:MAG: hypothetical protein HC856_07415 [Pseudanabaena sp. RU_4_16]|nr:hypothetical protein [Pseudanabaena sp. RU_4_16]